MTTYGPESRDRLPDAADPSPLGVYAALETFYYALNHRDLDALRENWSADPSAQLNNPVGGILRGGEAIAALYARIFAGPVRVQVTFGLLPLTDWLLLRGRVTGAGR